MVEPPLSRWIKTDLVHVTPLSETLADPAPQVTAVSHPRRYRVRERAAKAGTPRAVSICMHARAAEPHVDDVLLYTGRLN